MNVLNHVDGYGAVGTQQMRQKMEARRSTMAGSKGGEDDDDEDDDSSKPGVRCVWN